MAGIFDVIGNPFANAAGAGGGAAMPAMGDTSYFPPAPSAPPPATMTSRLPPIQPVRYNPMTDPQGPLANAGWIGALLFGNGPTKQEYLMSKEEQRLRQLGTVRAAAYQKLSGLVSQGMSPQKAFLSFINTPEGADFIISDPNPQEAVGQFMKLATVDPKQQALADVFGSGGAGQPQQPGVDIFTGQPQAGAQPGAAMPGQPAGTSLNIFTGQQEVDPLSAIQQMRASGLDAERMRGAAKRLLAAGATEEANAALKLADQYDELAKPPATDELKEYDRYVQQETQAGREPLPWMDYKIKMSQAGSTKINLNTAAGVEQKRMEARIAIDTDAAKEVTKAALDGAKAMSALDDMERITNNVQGGYIGALAPYMAKIAETFGMDIPDSWSDAEKMQALSMQLLPLVRQPGQVSNYEQQKYIEALPSLVKTREGRIKIIAALKRTNQRLQDIARIYRDNIGDPNLQDKLTEAYSQPMFTEDEVKQFEQLAQTSQPAGGSQQQPAAGAPQAGTIEVDENTGKSYEFLGGDPTDQKNWKEVKPATSGGGGY